MRILVVEDDSRIANFVAKGLREQAYAVDVTANGEDALYQASINAYDLAILDVMIPAPDGFEVCRRLRQSDLRFPILMLTARDATDDRVRGLDTGADDYLTKPFEFRELLARLRALLRRSGELRPNRIEVEDLARNAGRVVGREEISEHVWDETFDPFTNTIEVYVNRLRRKIDGPSANPLIHTRRGAGYMLGGAKVNSAPAQNAMLEGGVESREKRKPSAMKPAGEPRAAGKKHV